MFLCASALTPRTVWFLQHLWRMVEAVKKFVSSSRRHNASIVCGVGCRQPYASDSAIILGGRVLWSNLSGVASKFGFLSNITSCRQTLNLCLAASLSAVDFCYFCDWNFTPAVGGRVKNNWKCLLPLLRRKSFTRPVCETANWLFYFCSQKYHHLILQNWSQTTVCKLLVPKSYS